MMGRRRRRSWLSRSRLRGLQTLHRAKTWLLPYMGKPGATSRQISTLRDRRLGIDETPGQGVRQSQGKNTSV